MLDKNIYTLAFPKAILDTICDPKVIMYHKRDDSTKLGVKPSLWW